MALVAAKCPNCGANLEVDATKDAAVCPFCNTAYITQKAIINYNQTIINNTTINADTVNIVAGDFDKLMEKARASFESQDLEDAHASAVKALELNPKHEEAQLIKTICVGYRKRDLAPAHKVFADVFKNYNLNEKSALFEKEYLDKYLALIMAEFRAILSDSSTFIDDKNNLSDTFNGYEIIVKNLQLATSLYKKLYEFNENYKDTYIQSLEISCEILNQCCEKIPWLWVVDANGKHYRNSKSPNEAKYKSLITEYEAVLFELSPDYVAKTKESQQSDKKRFTAILIAGSIVFFIGFVFLIVAATVPISPCYYICIPQLFVGALLILDSSIKLSKIKKVSKKTEKDESNK